MPFLEEAEGNAQNVMIPRERVDRAPEQGPFVRDTLASAFRLDNTIGSILSATGGEDGEYDESHDPFGTVGLDSVYFRNYADRFAGSRNEQDTLRIRDKIDRELSDRQIVEDAGGVGVAATLAAGLIDPINLLPGGTIVKGVKGGVSVLKTVRSAAVAGAVAGATAEAILQSTQETRTPEETAFAISGSALLSGVLGGAAGSFLKRSPVEVDAAVERDMIMPEDGSLDVYSPGGLGSSAGASQVLLPDNTPKTLGAAIGKLDDERASLFVRGIRDISPVTRLESGPSTVARRVVESLAESVTVLQKAARGEAQARLGSAETRMKLRQAPLADALEDLDNSFLQYRFQGNAPKVLGKAKAQVESLTGKTERLSFTDFKKEVAIAMRNGDDHAIPEVRDAAKNIRTKVYEPLKDKAIELGLLPEDVDVSTAISYLNRVYDKERIRAQRGAFKGKIVEWLKQERDAAQERASFPVDVLDAKTRVNALRADIRQALSARDGAKKVLRTKRAKLEGEGKATRKKLRGDETELRRGLKRDDDLQPTSFKDAAERAFYSELLRDIKSGVKVRTLQTDVISRGGLLDVGGDLKSIIGKGTRSRLINKKSGKDADDLVRELHEDGYFSEIREEDLTPQTLLDALERDIKGDAVVRVDEAQTLERRGLADALSKELDQAGYDVTKFTPEKLMTLLKGEDFQRKGSFIKGKISENKTRITRAVKAIERSDEEVLDLQSQLDDVNSLIFVARANGKEITEQIKTLRKDLSAALKARKKALKADKVDQFRADRDDLELDSISEEIIDRIISTPDGRLPYDVSVEPNASKGGKSSGLSSALRGRVFNIPDNLIQDFLENDIELLSRTYTRSMAADTELVERFGDVNLTTQIKEVVEDFNKKIAKAGDDETLAKKLQKQKDAAVRDIAGIRDRLRGTYGIPEDPDSILLRAGRVVRSLNYLRLLGGMTVSAIPDLARTVMVNGMSRTFSQGLIPLIKNFKAYRSAGREVKMAGTALDMVLDTRAMAIADIMDDYGRHSKFERGLRGATSSFGVVTLMAPWNAALKQFSGMVTMSRILENSKTLAKGGKLSETETEALARAGIDENLATRIWAEFEKNGEIVDGSVYLPKTEGWSDVDARTALRGAVVREVDKIVVTPGQEKPLFMSREGWKLITQFKSFAMASTQRTLLAGLQQRDAAALNGALLSIALGGLSYAAKQSLAGREIETEPRVFLSEAFDRSGLAGWFMEPHNLTAKLTRGNISLSGKPLSRYASRNMVGAMIGPTAGLITDIGTITGDSFSGEFSDKTARAVRRLAPYQNVFWMRNALDLAESGTNKALGVQGQ